nr:flagellin lysine-N-methylase [Lachnospiraceae bacterium]
TLKIREISFYSQFKCLAGECPKNCCRGWMIPLTGKDIERYKREKGLKGLLLRFAMSKDKKRGIVRFNKSCLKCVFHNKEGLCRLQLSKGHEYIPEVCRNYPRFLRNYGLFEERYIDLSCIEGAKLFLDNMRDLHFREYEACEESTLSVTNDDREYLKDLFYSREKVIGLIESSADYHELSQNMDRIFSYAEAAEKAFVKGETDFLRKNDPVDFDVLNIICFFPFNMSCMERIMHEELFDETVKNRDPFLYKLGRLYEDEFKKTRASDIKWDRAAGDFIKKHGELFLKYKYYYIYYLYEYYLRSYEDYSFIRNAFMGMIHLNCIFMFDLLCEKQIGALTSELQADIISSYNKKAFFSNNLSKKMYDDIFELIYQ